MFAFRTDKTIHVSPDIARAMCGVKIGYKVDLHAVPGFMFHVEADSVDHAQRIAYTIARRDLNITTDAATVQRIAP